MPDALLTELKEQWEYDHREWDDIREQGRIDMLCVGGKVWEALAGPERQAREGKRPTIAPDEIGQYVNQLINEVRASKRAIQVNPEGHGANDETARFRSNLIRQIEYKSKAQMAYTTAFENAVQRSYGFFRINTRFVRDTLKPDEPLTAQIFDQEVRIDPLMNPDLITPDCHALNPDLSDMKHCTVRESWTHEEFRRRFPDAEVQSFSPEAVREAGESWMSKDRLWIGETWCIKTKPRKLVLLPDPAGGPEPLAVWRDTIPKEDWSRLKGSVLRDRTMDNPTVYQYFLNGVEVLDTVEWPGKYIPIVGCLGKSLWLNEKGGKTTRHLMSMVRLMRDPVMAYAYAASCEVEVLGSVPRATYIGYKGQFDTSKDDWQRAHHEPVAYLEVAFLLEGAPVGTILPLPQRQSWDPPLQNIELAKESFRRAIQSASGSGFLPTQAQRRNEKSGVALKQIETSAQKGSYHFIDHYESSLAWAGVIIDDLIPAIYDTPRDLYVRKPDNSPLRVRVNDPQADPASIRTDQGDHDVTISTGPSYDSEREAQQEFIDALAGPTLQVIAQISGPQAAAAVLAMAIKMKNVGPAGEEIADLLMPAGYKDGGTPQIPPQVQQQLQQAQQMIQTLMQKNQALEQAIAADRVKSEASLQSEQLRGEQQKELAQIKGQIEYALQELKGQQEAAKLQVQGAQKDLDREDSQSHEVALAAADAAQASDQAERMREQAEMQSPDRPEDGL